MPSSNTKTIYLIRHAESLENENWLGWFTVFQTLARFDDWPRREDVHTAYRLANIDDMVDTPLSDFGKEQIKGMAKLIQNEKFVNNNMKVAYSPLTRARETAQGILALETHNKGENISRDGL